ncbi:bifunctional phosphopantothenoylcysteine decarboxylase/phosphopantothenate--cysteine ligase CoaBC [Rhodocytophaga rosea]|uniref:Coenzyme A biosynthesis bifunctional protein CoaBC n=1 Tax=Rhodocytophaga rosea TaxID=2704465 RepID=A0A6C0GNX7_9BACT|nr:bifunctional phosphopantothenoylcysteine decarboxylase/phosphopantothenate--cysteine ligase CoaBC [Rhodocytophaga rosea]QHT69739.1 bifunctional phosphopantothenoylcysteine decarboxylase/phosphopantothenate--cysteine ligase CoaBC [Rhodocytophaga rosea]
MLSGKKIIVGVSGSIAAYKSALLVRLLVKEGAYVKVVMTESAKEFITPLTLSTLSKHPVYSSFVKNESGEWNNHVDLGLWADVLVIAPASAHTLAKCANGLCDNLLTAVYLSAKCPVYFAPAMDLDMYKHPSTRHNIEKLFSYGNHIIGAEHGELASGLVGEGRMAEPESIVRSLQAHFSQNLKLSGKKALITAGPTCEDIDPVRYISNHSTGKMGYALAETLAQSGAHVTLVSGPASIPLPTHPLISLVKVRSAHEMHQACLKYFPESDIAVFAAAVADYTPKVKAEQKIKKKEDTFAIELVKTVDIAAALGKEKQAHQLMIGFALETENEMQHAQGKLQSKNLDMIVLNSLNDAGAAFGHDTNKITIIHRSGQTQTFPLKSKTAVAQDIVEVITEQVAKTSGISQFPTPA